MLIIFKTDSVVLQICNHKNGCKCILVIIQWWQFSFNKFYFFCYRKHTSGRICVNGRTRDVKMFRRRSCYILQDDKVHDMLTVHESLKVAAELKLGNHVSKQQKQQRVFAFLNALILMLITLLSCIAYSPHRRL